MAYYKISPSRVKAVIRYPERTEEGILPNTVAAMRRAGTKKDRETWVMYVPDDKKKGSVSLAQDEGSDEKMLKKVDDKKGLRVITAWIYPGISPERDPVPEHVLEEVRSALSLF